MNQYPLSSFLEKQKYRYIKIKTGGFTLGDREMLLDFLRENFEKVYVKIDEESDNYGRIYWTYRQV